MDSTKDIRLYAKFTLDFPDHPKIMPLSDAAFRCLIEATLWSRKHLTNGLLPRRFAIVRWSFEVVQELTQNDTLKPSLIECEEGWIIHDFAEHQTTREELEERRNKRKDAGRKGGIASGRSRREAKAKQMLKQTRSKTNPETETETETLKKELATQVPKKAATGTRLPDGWRPPDTVIAQMRSDHPHVDLKAEHEKFADYWAGIPGARGRKCDWVGTWRNWIRRAAERTNSTKPNKLRALSDLAAEVREAESDTRKELA